MSTPATAAASRRQELLRLAGSLFAERGYTNTTVRDIADAAGILSGSLYHHFDSKESIVDELLRTFQVALFAAYDEIVGSDLDPREKIDAVVRASFDAIDQHHDEVAIFQNDASHLMQIERFGYLSEHNRRFRHMWLELIEDGAQAGALREDLDPELTYRFVRDTVWVAVGWWRPGGRRDVQDVADEYLAILFHGISSTHPTTGSPTGSSA